MIALAVIMGISALFNIGMSIYQTVQANKQAAANQKILDEQTKKASEQSADFNKLMAEQQAKSNKMMEDLDKEMSSTGGAGGNIPGDFPAFDGTVDAHSASTQYHLNDIPTHGGVVASRGENRNEHDQLKLENMKLKEQISLMQNIKFGSVSTLDSNTEIAPEFASAKIHNDDYQYLSENTSFPYVFDTASEVMHTKEKMD